VSTPTWTAGTLYAPGAVVQRASRAAVVAQPPVNASFEDGDSGWTKESGWTIDQYVANFDGTYTARSRGFVGTYRIYQATASPVVPGLVLTASCQCRRGEDGMSGRIQIEWLTAGLASIRIDNGVLIDSGTDKWKESAVTATAPATAAFVRLGATVTQNHTGRNFYVDAFKWNYAYSPPIDALIFTAVQVDPGYSGGVEPIWPTVVGDSVVDNQVTWQAIDSSTVTWEAAPILVSGPNEPAFPLEVGATVADNTMIWTGVSRRVEDEKCPNTAIVAIAASKIFAADNDIVSYSATVNPLDWSTTDDAGYLPFGLQTYGSNPVSALGLYRSDLVPFNVSGFQLWAVDPDPQQMALKDAVPVGSRYHRALQPFQNDLFFLSEVGVRNIGIAGASTNLQAGTYGEPMDPIIRAWVKDGTYEPRSAFIPAYGQYWITFGYEADVLSTTGLRQMSWSRYVFPGAIDTITQASGKTYLRTAGDLVWVLDDDETADDVYCQPLPVVLFCDCEDTGLTSIISWYEAEFDTPIAQYIILRSKDGSLFVDIAEVNGDVLSYTDVMVEAGHTYRYMVVARPDPDEGIDSDPSNVVVCDFPAAEVPAGSSAASSAASSAPPDEECFNLYTTTADLTRVAGDGVAIDPELQFETAAGKAYWLYGHLRFRQANAAGSPGAQTNFTHAGDTLAFQSLNGQTSSFHNPLSVNPAMRWTPISQDEMGDLGYQNGGIVDTTSIMEVPIDALLVVGASGGTFGIVWGLNNLAALGSTSLLEGSYFTAIEVDVGT
jgi:hypothetical protein